MFFEIHCFYGPYCSNCVDESVRAAQKLLNAKMNTNQENCQSSDDSEAEYEFIPPFPVTAPAAVEVDSAEEGSPAATATDTIIFNRLSTSPPLENSDNYGNIMDY